MTLLSTQPTLIMNEPKRPMVSLIIPAYNEERAIASTISTIREMFERNDVENEIIVVDDGSHDQTACIAQSMNVLVIKHPENLGYGAALKSGIRCARHEWIGIIDADGTYPIEELPLLLQHIPAFDMVVGARTGQYYRGSFLKHPSREIFKWLAEFVTGRRIPDINSGMRLFRRDIVLYHISHISNGFSFTTTLTLAMMLENYFVKYVPISYHPRIGSSHVRYFRDTLRAAQIIVQAILYYNPIKLFLLLVMISIGVTLFTGILILLLGTHPLLLLGWGGLNLAIFFFGMGALAYVIRSTNIQAQLETSLNREK